MGSGRITIALVSAAATAVTTVGLTAPTGTAATAGQESTTRGGTVCRSALLGVLPNNRFLRRNMRNGSVERQITTSRPLPFRATNLGFFSSRTRNGVTSSTYIAITRDGRPRLLTVREGSSRRSTFGVRRMLNRNFEPRLFTNSGGFHVFALSGGVLRRLVTYRTDAGRIVFDDARRVRVNTRGLKTLTFYTRQRLGGVRQDVLYATTRGGALKQIRVPVRRPGNARAITVKRSGFGQVTGLSLGRCNDNTANAFIVAINANRNVAHRFTLTRQHRPSAANLSRARSVAPAYNWRIRATL